MSRILVIDDDIELCELLTDYLSAEGFEVDAVNDSVQGLAGAVDTNYALVVLDVMLPGMNGFEVLRLLRQKSRVPVLMLTARGDDVDRIVGLEMGADDYLPKPFNPRELVARIRAIQRRSETLPEKSESGPAAPQLTIGDLELDGSTRTVRRGGCFIELTAVEFSLLEMLMRSAGKVVEREELVRKVLGRRLSPYDRSIDVHISSLRKKLGNQVGNHERIKTVRGLGYIYADTGRTCDA